MNKFREHQPQRTCSKRYANYREYKRYLAADFLNRCGYTDCPDIWFGGMDNFHIDHFIPWKKFPENPDLKVDYQNLVYSCSYVNISKSDDTGNYLDPCNYDFNDHFCRDSYGSILPKPHSDAAKYMHKKLKLYLKRYQIIWMLDKLETKMAELQKLRKKTSLAVGHRAELNEMIADLSCNYFEYKKYLKSH